MSPLYVCRCASLTRDNSNDDDGVWINPREKALCVYSSKSSMHEGKERERERRESVTLYRDKKQIQARLAYVYEHRLYAFEWQ